MGCRISSCCAAVPAGTPRVAPRKQRNKKQNTTHPSVQLERNTAAADVLISDVVHRDPDLSHSSLLQHISEREPDDLDCDPSSNPRTGPLFMQRSRSDIRSLKERRQSQLNLLEARPLKKSSSCSTIFLDDSTVSHPNLKNTIKCVSLAIHYHLMERRQGDSGNGKTYEIFDERIHPLSQDNRDNIRPPDYRTIYRFMRTLFNAAQLPPECAIITLVYVERLLTYAETEIDAYSWKRIVLASILLASKVWDDQAVWNVDYCQILRDIPVEDMNDLERCFLELLQFNINVPQSVYAKYYFDLRTLAGQSDISFLLEPLSKERAERMEAMSKHIEEKSCEPVCNGIRKWSSLEHVNSSTRSRAILS